MFFFFSVACTWILINVLLTIIIESFERVNSYDGFCNNSEILFLLVDTLVT